MTDMLVKLYDVPDHYETVNHIKRMGMDIRRPLAPERSLVLDWIHKNFIPAWVDEAAVAFARNPISCFIAVHENQIRGFACYDVTAKGFFGPTGVQQTHRDIGIGRALMVHTFKAMQEAGYGYAILGHVSTVDYYQRHAHATIIENSSPGIYAGMLKHNSQS